MLPKIIVILGPTASGKSDVAVKLARKFNGEIISADSRQVYKGLDIGTGKITKKEMRGVPHHILSVANPRNRFTVAQYVKVTNRAIIKMLPKNKLPIICGGTGFYIQALVDGIVLPEVAPNPKLRKQLWAKPVEELWKILENLDPERAGEIDRYNPVRLVRAIEIALVLGKVPKLELRDKSYDVCKIGIKVPQKKLDDKINKRITKWFKRGFLKEVQNLHKKGLAWKRMAEIGLEYKLVALYLQNKLTKKELIWRMQIETKQYAKRQMTWFKRDENIKWLKPNIKIIEKEVKKFLT